MRIKRPLALGVVASLALATFAAAAPASADPVSGGIVLVGSDTLQDSVNALTNGTTISGSLVRVTSGDGTTLGNFDAFGSDKIQTKSTGPYFTRPSGSGEGLNALSASIDGNKYHNVVITGQVDIARSSKGPGSNANSAGKLLYVPYARDAVAYAFVDSNGDLASLSTADLKKIYEANTPTTIGTTVVKPLIPQSASGTRSFFLSAIGVTTLGSQVSSMYGGVDNTLPENDASVLTTVGNVVPFSAASWIAQSNGAAPSTIPTSGTIPKLGSPNGVAPFTGTGSSLVPSSTYYTSSFGRDTYLIVEYARVDSSSSTYDANLAALLDPTKAKSLTNFGTSPTSAGAVKRKFGFLAVADTNPIRAYATLPL